MPVQVSPKRQVKGLYSNLNQSSGIPEGGLLEADNCVVDRPGILSKRKGFNRYGGELSSFPGSVMDYDGSLVVHNGTNISADATNDGNFVSWGDIYQAPGGVHDMRGAPIKKNFYFTSQAGVYRNDSLTSTPVLAGMPEGLDIEIEKTGTGGGWFYHNNQVGYRVVWSREDANKSVIVGEPSYRHVDKNFKTAVTLNHDGVAHVEVTHKDHGFASDDIITISSSAVIEYNGPGKTVTVMDADTYRFSFAVDAGGGNAFAGKDYDLNLKLTVPGGIVAGDKYMIYRTALSTGVAVDPGTDHLLVAEKEITAAQVSAGIVEFSDTTLTISLGAYLYTNSSQEGITQRNTRPPQCKDITVHRGHMFCADLTYRHEKEIHLDEIKDIVNGDSISIKVGVQTLTYKFAEANVLLAREFKLHTAESTTEENIEITARNLVRMINRDPNNTLLYAHYTSGDADAAGKVLLRTRIVQANSFSVTANSTTVGESFKEVIPTSGETFAPEDNTIPNGLAYSKVLEPDAVPGANIIYVGTKNEPIQRIIPLKTSLIILKADGVWKLSGNTPSTFVLLPLDMGVRAKFPNAVALLNDAVYCLATQGILRINESGTVIVSYPIEDRLRNITSYTGCDKIAFAVANEENRRVMIFTQDNSGDSHAKIGWVYNYLTKEWTTWKKPVSCGVSLRGNRDLYLGHALDEYVLKERNGISKRNSGDYSDEDIPVTVTVVAGTTVTFTYDYRVPIRAGFLFSQGYASSKISSITSVTGTTVIAVLERVPRGGIAVAAATVSLPIDSIVKWAPHNMGSSEHPKQFTYAMITMESGTALTNELGFYTDAVPKAEWVSAITLSTPEGWGQGKWGSSPWGNEESVAVVPLTSAVPRQHQRCRELTLMYRHRVAKEEFDIESVAFRVRVYKGKLVRMPE